MTPLNAKSYRRPVVKTNLYIVYANMAIYTKKMELNDMPHVNVARGGHTPLCFVTTCDNGVFNGGVFMHFSINFPALFVDIKLL